MMDDKPYPFLNGILKGVRVRDRAFDSYFAEQTNYGSRGLDEILDAGKQFGKRLAKALAEGGSAIFPHTYLSKCGDQIAAVVHACLDSGADQVLALGVMHPMNDALMQARTKEFNLKDISQESSWGVLGPSFNRDLCWQLEFSLSHFKLLWDREVNRRGITPPKLIECYPSLTNRRPDLLPGIVDLKKIAQDSVVVATDDMCHHGVAYGVSPDDALNLGEGAERFARDRIEQGFKILEEGDFSRYFDFWMDPHAIGDPSDTSIVLRYLLGEVAYQLLDLKIVDVTELFAGDTQPSWVAAALVEVSKL